MLQVFMTSAELHEHCFPSQELPRPKQLQIKLGDCPNLSECLSGICIGPRVKKALPIWTIIDLGLAKGFSKTALCVCCCSITLSSPEPSPEQTKACEPTARSPQPENKSKSKTWQNPAKLRTQTLYNFYPRIKKALPIWTMIDLGLAKGFSKTALCDLCVCC